MYYGKKVIMTQRDARHALNVTWFKIKEEVTNLGEQ